jgi:hypothetical protein
MTDCCLLVFLRPRTYLRLVRDLYPKGSSGFEKSLSPVRLKRLCLYASSYPDKIALICAVLQSDIEEAVRQGKVGFAKVGVESLRGLVEVAYGADPSMSFAVEPHLRAALLTCFACRDSEVHLAACGLFLLYTLQSDRCDVGPYVRPVLALCRRGMAGNSSSADEQSVGLELLLRVVEVLLSHAGAIERHAGDILAVVYYYFGAQRVYFVKGAEAGGPDPRSKQAGAGAGADRAALQPRSPTVLSSLCLVALGSASCPATFAHILAALLVKLDETRWEPAGPAVKAINLLLASSVVLNSFDFPICSFLLTHARNIASNPLGWSRCLTLDDFLVVSPEQRRPNYFGSETALRTVLLRAQVLLKVLSAAADLSSNISVIAAGGGGGGKSDAAPAAAAAGNDCILFNKMLSDRDTNNIMEVLVFCALNSKGAILGEGVLPPGSFVGIDLNGKGGGGNGTPRLGGTVEGVGQTQTQTQEQVAAKGGQGQGQGQVYEGPPPSRPSASASGGGGDAGPGQDMQGQGQGQGRTLRAVSEVCLQLLAAVVRCAEGRAAAAEGGVDCSCLRRERAYSPLSPSLPLSNSPLAQVLAFHRRLPERFEFVKAEGCLYADGDADAAADAAADVDMEAEADPGSVAQTMRVAALQAINVALAASAAAVEGAGPGAGTGVRAGAGAGAGPIDKVSRARAAYRYLFPAVRCGSGGVGDRDLYALLCVLESPNFGLFRLAASSAALLISLLLRRAETEAEARLPDLPLSLSLSLWAHNDRSSAASAHVVLSCLYDSMFRDLVVFDEAAHAERVASNWLIQKRVMGALGVRELALGLPRFVSVYRFWQDFEFASDVLVQGQHSFCHCVELLSSQILLFSAYFHALSALLDIPDLSLMAAQWERECMGVFPSAPDATAATAAATAATAAAPRRRKRGRRLEVRHGSDLLLSGVSKEDIEHTGASSGSGSGTGAGAGAEEAEASVCSEDSLRMIYHFLKTRIDLGAVEDALCSGAESTLRAVVREAEGEGEGEGGSSVGSGQEPSADGVSLFISDIRKVRWQTCLFLKLFFMCLCAYPLCCCSCARSSIILYLQALAFSSL